MEAIQTPARIGGHNWRALPAVSLAAAIRQRKHRLPKWWLNPAQEGLRPACGMELLAFIIAGSLAMLAMMTVSSCTACSLLKSIRRHGRTFPRDHQEGRIYGEVRRRAFGFTAKEALLRHIENLTRQLIVGRISIHRPSLSVPESPYPLEAPLTPTRLRPDCFRQSSFAVLGRDPGGSGTEDVSRVACNPPRNNPLRYCGRTGLENLSAKGTRSISSGRKPILNGVHLLCRHQKRVARLHSEVARVVMRIEAAAFPGKTGCLRSWSWTGRGKGSLIATSIQFEEIVFFIVSSGFYCGRNLFCRRICGLAAGDRRNATRLAVLPGITITMPDLVRTTFSPSGSAF